MYDMSYIAEIWGDIEEKIANKRKFYSVIIGGNPRNSDKWDSFDDMIL